MRATIRYAALEAWQIEVSFYQWLIQIEVLPKVCRFHSILYNAEAIQAEKNCEQKESDSSEPESVLFLRPMGYDEEVSIFHLHYKCFLC